MKNPKIVGLVGAVAVLSVLAVGGFASRPKVVAPKLSRRSVAILQVAGLAFKDSNKNGPLDAYEDWRKSASERAVNLLQQMTLEEKAGVMMHGTAPAGTIGTGSRYDLRQAERLFRGAKVNTFISRLSGNANDLAAENNKLQEIAESERLGIPLTISTDPRNQFHFTVGGGVAPGDFSQWPGPLGLAAIHDSQLVRRFADIARQEYLAVGIRQTA